VQAFHDEILRHGTSRIPARDPPRLLGHPQLGPAGTAPLWQDDPGPGYVAQQAELDLLIDRGTHKLGFEFKYGSAPRMSRSLAKAQQLLGLDSLTVVYPGDQDYPLAEGIRARSLKSLVDAPETDPS